MGQRVTGESHITVQPGLEALRSKPSTFLARLVAPHPRKQHSSCVGSGCPWLSIMSYAACRRTDDTTPSLHSYTHGSAPQRVTGESHITVPSDSKPPKSKTITFQARSMASHPRQQHSCFVGRGCRSSPHVLCRPTHDTTLASFL